MGTTETGLQQGSHGVGLGGEESTLLVSTQFWQLLATMASGRIQATGVCPHTGSCLLYFSNTGVNQLQVQIWKRYPLANPKT